MLHWILAALSSLLVWFLLSFVFALPVLWIWNGVLVEVFPYVHEVSWWQAWCLGILARFLIPTSTTNITSKG